jgi:hypothetical protein
LPQRRAGGHGGRAVAIGPDERDHHPSQSDADVFGELLMFFQLATGYGGIWYGVDPFNQPGVELGKQLTFGAMGRAGYEAHRDASPPDESDTIL